MAQPPTKEGSTFQAAIDHSEYKRLREIIIKRSSIKGQITKFKNYLTLLEKKSHLSVSEVAELSLKLGKFEALSLRFDELQDEIEVLNEVNLSLEIDEREHIEREFITHMVTAKGIIGNQNRIESEERRASMVPTAQCNHDHQDLGIKLPQIHISKFDGAFFRWLEFRDSFEGLIHNNSKLTPIHKFHYLVSYLEGDAARIVSNLELSSANYPEAWKLLCDRYNNKRLLINHHLSSLFNIQQFSRESERSLRFLVDHVTKNLRALASLGQPTDKWDMLIIFMLSSKLDSHTLMKWEEFRNSLDDVPSLDEFKKFLTDRADVLESLNQNKFNNNYFPKNQPSTSRNPTMQNNNKNSYNNNKQEKQNYTKSFAATNQDKPLVYSCVICNESHRIYDCITFKTKSLKERLTDVAKYKLCSNCLRQGHPVSDCRMGPCRICNKRHNSLLHNPSPTTTANAAVDETDLETDVYFSKQDCNQILLSTALIEVSNPSTNQTMTARALLDCGSQSSFITKNLKERLSLKSIPIDTLKIIGIGNNCSNKIDESCTAQIKSLNTKFNVTLSCFVLKELTSHLPKAPIDIRKINLPENIKLADPGFNQPAPIDVLIGADIFWDILGNEQRSLGNGNPKLRSSKLGWLISGPIASQISTKDIQCNHALTINKSDENLDKMLTKFWDLENVPQKPKFTETEEKCEKHFLANAQRLDNGRFCVRLPLIDTPDCLGDTFHIAKKRLFNLEKRFKRNPKLKTEYSTFLKEYAELGHLSESAVTEGVPTYYFCHHAVLKESSESTKLRVVFDGSAPSSSGYSLNDLMMIGPNMQDSLFAILIRARHYKFILTGDIEKMYRQVNVAESDRNLQLILWREDDSQPIKTLQLNTLTYGTASASYLSTRCLWQLGEEHNDDIIKTIIQHDFYVDDLITGCDDEEQLRYIQKAISQALLSGCFNLRKYKSNLTTLFQNCDINNQENLTISESSSTLGLGWNPSNDSLNFPIKEFSEQNDKVTKRLILSNSFKIFDPLGLLSPCIIQPKIILQRLWQQKVDWDQPVPQDIYDDWKKFCSGLPALQSLQVPRLVLGCSPNLIELHTFSDASQLAYGACIYMKSIGSDGDVTVKLLCSKSKVAPIRPITMPRLELCAALLAARLCNMVLESLRFKPSRIIHWCDSSIVLSWINSDLSKLKCFAANRIFEIKETTQPSSWRYVPTDSNPADLISRGVNASQLICSTLWWSGPGFLAADESEWPVLQLNTIENLPETKSHVAVPSEPKIHFQNYSKLYTLQKVFAYVKRFIHNLKNPKNRLSGLLSLDELDNSFNLLCAVAQEQSFPLEYDLLLNGKPLSSKAKILSLSPFIDDKKVVRVGGRIDASSYSYEKKHPILLHSSHHLTKLIFEREHLRSLHAGPQLLLARMREIVWPVNGRHLARSTVNKCVQCRRHRGKTLCPKMGGLPPQRITPGLPFQSVGLDFAGPFYIVNRKGRGNRLVKCYLCVFVCLRYKCIHLEGVTDLTKDAFIMTLRRFIGRRGKPVEVFCDNGRNFVAAAKEIANFLKSNSDPLTYFANNEGIKFIFTPTYAPHFGGIWEAGVKSAKHHLKRVIGNSHLTFEEISTLFVQVEAVLNSRPLYPLSASPNDLLSLTPGHFLVGRPLTALPSPDLRNCKESSLRRYARIEKMLQHFWQRWQREYIAELQQRTKWKTNTASLNVGDLVLLQEDYVSPLCWRLGRIERLFPGPDGIARVADVNTTRGCVRRPLVRFCPLPSAQDYDS